eukprot:322118-Pelagomonas_calceolata.AAC.7
MLCAQSSLVSSEQRARDGGREDRRLCWALRSTRECGKEGKACGLRKKRKEVKDRYHNRCGHLGTQKQQGVWQGGQGLRTQLLQIRSVDV